ncbi:MAG: type II toxin-antitoxin system RelE/ParE family toxin [Desulforudis sp.]|nr:MAG: type II toxin-antitoxin system RelE/ParE family toxin [Desulforudis sp.]
MSSRKPLPVRLSPRARLDFIDILRYTGETWGKDQLVTYRDKINEALLAVSRNPQLGHRREDLPPTYRTYLVESHIIIYRIFENYLGVVRILHQRMGLTGHI